MAKPQQTKPEADKPKRKIPEKCLRCALLEADVAQEVHGPNGDGCWNPKVCYARRSHAKHRDRRNTTRNLKNKGVTLPDIKVEVPKVLYGVLVVYRAAGADTPVHAIAAEVWNGSEKHALVPAVHCEGLVPSQVHQYVQQVLNALEEHYGIKKFASQVRREVFECPLRPCPHHSAGRT
jgi:hypothetical protein